VVLKWVSGKLRFAAPSVVFSDKPDAAGEPPPAHNVLDRRLRSPLQPAIVVRWDVTRLRARGPRCKALAAHYGAAERGRAAQGRCGNMPRSRYPR
jgi:hypothetical protein